MDCPVEDQDLPRDIDQSLDDKEFCKAYFAYLATFSEGELRRFDREGSVVTQATHDRLKLIAERNQRRFFDEANERKRREQSE
jgi:hypothetical protein